ncbi:MAG: hypothetical protein QM784_17445 [Polyangiaceae bacterium]
MHQSRFVLRDRDELPNSALHLTVELAHARPPAGERQALDGRTQIGIDVQLKEEDSAVLAQVDDFQNALARATSGALSETRLLKYLMPWGDTVFNEAQANDLRDDVRQLIRSQPGTPLADVLVALVLSSRRPSTPKRNASPYAENDGAIAIAERGT